MNSSRLVKTLQTFSAFLILFLGPLFSVNAQTSDELEDSFEASRPLETQEFTELTEISDDLYMFRFWVYRTIFLVTDAGVIVADPINPQAAGILMEEIRKITDQPIEYVVYSHEHWDHAAGGQIFKDAGAEFIAQENCVDFFRERPNPLVVMPDITFNDFYELTLGGKTIELQYFGRNHGNCLVTMRLPEERLIFIVDIVTPKRLPFRGLPDFWPEDWIRTLREIEQLEFDGVIPGHGPDDEPAVAARSSVREQREFLEDLMSAVKEIYDTGVYDPQVLGDRLELPKYSDWRGYEWLPLNAERIRHYYHLGW